MIEVTGLLEAGRLVSFLFGFGTLLLVLKICKELYDKKTSHLAMFLLASSPAFFALSAHIMQETMMVFFSTLSILSLLKYREEKRNRYLFAVGISIFLSAFAKWPGIFTLIGVGICLLYTEKERAFRKPAIYVSMFFPLILSLAWYFHIQEVAVSVSPSRHLIGRLFFNLEASFLKVIKDTGFELTTRVPLTTLLLALVGISQRKNKDRIILAWLLSGIVFYLIFLQGAFKHGHYGFLMVPPLAILGSRSIISISGKIRRLLKTREMSIFLTFFITFLTATAGGAIYLHIYYEESYGSYVKDAKLAGNYLQQNAGDNGLIALDSQSRIVYYHTNLDIDRIRTTSRLENISIKPKIFVFQVKNPAGENPVTFKGFLTESKLNEKIASLRDFHYIKDNSYFRIIMKNRDN